MSEKLKDKIATGVLYLLSGLVVLILISLIIYILGRGLPSITPAFLFGASKSTEAGSGIGPQIFNSFYLLIVTLLITVPLGVGAGIYLSEYAKEGPLVNIIRLCIDTMASLPSIVVGLFGLIVFVQMANMGYSLIAGTLVITVLNLPAVTRVSETAIKAASGGVKEASLGLGATKWQTIQKVILPSAMPQILTGVILASGRIFGEAAALMYTSGMNNNALSLTHVAINGTKSAFSVTRSAETLAVYIWQVNSEKMIPDATKVANGASAVLIIFILIFNFSARFIGKKIYESYSGKK